MINDRYSLGAKKTNWKQLGFSIVSGTMLSMVIAPAGLAQAPAPAGSPAAQAEDPIAIYREIGIGAEQETQIKQLVRDFEADITAKIDGLRKLMKEMKDLSLTPAPDEPAVLAKQDEINRAQNDISTERVRLLLKIRSLLSKEQKQKLVEMMQHQTGQ
jgi:Spy/CpxP family protein refolding chaperone